MTRCPCCGSPTPAPERIQPVGVQVYCSLPVKEEGNVRPALVLWNCPGSRTVDMGLLRYGVIVPAPWSCGAPRSTRWEYTTFDLRRRAFEQERLRLALNGWI